MSEIDYTGVEYYIIGFIISWIFLVHAKRYGISTNNNSSICGRNSYWNNIFRKDNVFLFLSFIALWIIPAIRGKVGLDYDSYLRGFDSINKIDDIFNFEPGYCLSILAIKQLGGDFQTLLFVYSTITGWLLWKSLYRDVSNMTLALVGLVAINYYFMPMTVIRQFLAISIVLQSIPHITQRRLSKFLLILITAIAFHYTAIVFGILYLVVPSSKSNKVFTFKGVFLILLLIASLWSIDSLLGAFLPFITSVKSNYSSYFEINNLKYNILSIISVLPVSFFALTMRKKLLRLSPRLVVYIWMSLIMIIMYVLALMIPAISRLHYYYDFCIPVLLSYSPMVFQRKARFIVILLVIIYFAYMISNIFQYQWNDFLPYEPFF